MSQFRIERWNNLYAPNGAMLRFTMEREGYRVHQWSDLPGAVYGLRKSVQEQSRWILSGSIEITVEGSEPYLLQTGDRDFMPGGVWYSMRVLGDGPKENTVDEKEPDDGEERERTEDEPKPVIYLVGEKIR